MNLITESCKEDSNVSAMRVLNYIALGAAMLPYVLINFSNMVSSIIKGTPAQISDIPTAAAGIVAACIAMKAVQSFAEKGKV